MEPDTMSTPNKILYQSPSIRTLNSYGCDRNKPVTPRNSSYYTPNTLQRKNSKFRLFNVANTPPSRFPKIVNPFEAALSDRSSSIDLQVPNYFYYIDLKSRIAT